ncbi:bifunctional lysylphosphatidylglycerol flippase/synthetase MprF [Roseomonas sp. GC11]|uniref:bifunctional lysylphosphatidylglycerol flippase/synthetase MprF n=1 Tax=Roseomonas sp. GC11 TaxID=2950546 RepID=UPI00210E098D|nr:bifunctional lysylphosphatidylglycerol flippase/synthetase MprF [Roseomonas sp. GC11]MCQ4161169.1 bifunctional lysylphosphatidylglycerol flippase/synthetase MprF [Roseomonas sp. GC11]
MNGLTPMQPPAEPMHSAALPPVVTPRARRWAMLRPWLLLGAGAVMAALALLALHGLSHELDYATVMAGLSGRSPWVLAAALGATALSFAGMMGYDLSALRHVAPGAVPRRIAMLAAFCGFALSNTVGVGAFTGAAVRWRIYAAAGLKPESITRLLVFVTASFIIGLFACGALGLLATAESVDDWSGLPPWALRGIALLVLGALGGLVLLGRLRPGGVRIGRYALRVPSSRMLVFQGLVSVLDIGAAATVLWVLLPEGAVDLPFFMALYAVAIAIGAASHLPGGIGVFEAVVLLAFRDTGVSLDEVASALVLYRLIYFALPLCLALLLLAGFEVSRRAHLLQGGTRAVRSATRLMPRFLGATAFAAGTALLFGGVTPPAGDVPWLLAPALPLPLFEASHLIASVGGLLLLFVAHGLLHRLDGAWWLALVLALGGLVLTIARGGGELELGLLSLLAIALLASRERFDRRARMMVPSFTPGWWLAVAGVVGAATWLLFFAHRDVEYSRHLWWEFELDASAPRGMRATLGVVLSLFAAGLWALMRPARSAVRPATPEELARATAITAGQERADANLVRMGDKALLFSEQGDAFVMYGRRGRSWIALSDPVGPKARRADMVWRFVELADAQGGRAAFYQVRPENLPYYIDAGLQPLKLGEAARVPLEVFSLTGKSRQPLRSALNRAEREGLTFEWVPPDQVLPLLPELKEISDLWLAQHRAREKAFSLGAFEPAYVAAQPIAVVRGPEGRILAFATILDTPERHADMSIDLMRHRPVTPPGTMDFLFLKLILRAKDQGYAWFDLGMAPLSGLAAHRLAPTWYRLGGLLFRRGERFYNFRGLRAFKDKFEPVWEPRYLCTPGGLDPWVVLADVAALQAGGLRGVIGK